jgi:hypothetical protein
VSDTL